MLPKVFSLVSAYGFRVSAVDCALAAQAAVSLDVRRSFRLITRD